MNNVSITVQYTAGYEKIFEIASSVGFKYVNMGFGSSDVFEKSDWEEKIYEIKQKLDKYGLKCSTTHAPYYDLLISAEISSEALDESQKRCVLATKMLGADIVAFHPRTHLTNGQSKEKSFKENVKAFTPLVEVAKKCNVKIGIENIPIFPDHLDIEFYSCYTEDQIKLIDFFGSENVCGVWDTGHANLMNYNQADAIKKLGTRIKATHIHNNHKEMDAHILPSLGTIDWDGVMSAFKEIDYKGDFTSESIYIDNSLIDLYIKHLYDDLSALKVIFDKA